LVLRYKYGKRLFKEFITTRSLKPFNYRDVPEFVLEYYPSLQHRYWNKVKNDAVINVRINILHVLTQHEKRSLSETLKNNKNKTLQNNKLNPILFLKKFLFKLFGIKLQKHKQRLKDLLYISNGKDFLGLLRGMIFLPCL
jgi:type I site-specific restriction endonuclease